MSLLTNIVPDVVGWLVVGAVSFGSVGPLLDRLGRARRRSRVVVETRLAKKGLVFGLSFVGSATVNANSFFWLERDRDVGEWLGKRRIESARFRRVGVACS